MIAHLVGGTLVEQRIPLSAGAAEFGFDLQAAPVGLSLDPRFDVFRRLAPGETPITVSALFGAEQGLILLPSAAKGALQEGYRRLADAWSRGSAGWKTRSDDSLDGLPANQAVWILGWENRFAVELSRTAGTFTLEPESRRFETEGDSLGGDKRSIALVAEPDGRPLGLVATADPTALPGLARKLPHYGKYSYLSFEGPEPTNRVKGQWPASDNRLQVWFTDRRPSLDLPPLPPLTDVLEESKVGGQEHSE
jgi:hypothetical protein